MPCFRTGSAWGDARLSADEAREEVTELTRLLCQVCKSLEREGKSFLLPFDVRAWWDKHKSIDSDRERSLRRQALGKLTSEERAALGIWAQGDD